jgi:C-terminal processing protease CtpA/Prc
MHALLLAPSHSITIKDLVQGLAAHKSGQLQQGDVLVSVDGRSVEGYDLDQVF